MAKSIKIMFFWNMMPCRFVEEYQGFDEDCSLQLQGKGLSALDTILNKFCPSPILTT